MVHYCDCIGVARIHIVIGDVDIVNVDIRDIHAVWAIVPVPIIGLPWGKRNPGHVGRITAHLPFSQLALFYVIPLVFGAQKSILRCPV